MEYLLSFLEENAEEERSFELIDKAKKENESHYSEESSIKFSLSLSPEIYSHTKGSEYNLEFSWVHGFDYRRPFLSAEMDLDFSSRLYTPTSL